MIGSWTNSRRLMMIYWIVLDWLYATTRLRRNNGNVSSYEFHISIKDFLAIESNLSSTRVPTLELPNIEEPKIRWSIAGSVGWFVILANYIPHRYVLQQLA